MRDSPLLSRLLFSMYLHVTCNSPADIARSLHEQQFIDHIYCFGPILSLPPHMCEPDRDEEANGSVAAGGGDDNDASMTMPMPDSDFNPDTGHMQP